MNIADFDFRLPSELIATYPAAHRDESRLLVLDRETGRTIHAFFYQIGDYLPQGSLLIVNDTRVIRARLHGRKPTGGRFELLLTRRADVAEPNEGAELWEGLGRNLGTASPGTTLELDGLTAVLIERGDRGAVRVRIHPPPGTTVLDILEQVGEIPLPPYIEGARQRMTGDQSAGGPPTFGPNDQHEADAIRYQTVYAREPGAVAAPTAGLHFTPELLARLKADGHQVVPLTLHVGPGTFRPVEVSDPTQHRMDPEWYSISPETASAIEQARAAGRPIVAVGTTVVRALESAARAASEQGDAGATIRPGTAATRLFLYPGATFHVVTDLITNFHLPRSTLLMLVSAFARRDSVLAAYAEAVAARYRFYSYGDAMLIRGPR